MAVCGRRRAVGAHFSEEAEQLDEKPLDERSSDDEGEMHWPLGEQSVKPRGGRSLSTSDIRPAHRRAGLVQSGPNKRRESVQHVDLTSDGANATEQRLLYVPPPAPARRAAWPAAVPAASRAPPAASMPDVAASPADLYPGEKVMVVRERGRYVATNPELEQLCARAFEAAAYNTIPTEMVCPITGQLMRHPVIAGDGYSYEAEAWQVLVQLSRGCLIYFTPCHT